MSMNLNLTVDGEHVNLFQTPTYVTNMCLVDSKGKVHSGVKGVEAKRAIHIYLRWVKDELFNGRCYSSQEDLDEDEQSLSEHVDLILGGIKNGKVIVVYQQ